MGQRIAVKAVKLWFSHPLHHDLGIVACVRHITVRTAYITLVHAHRYTQVVVQGMRESFLKRLHFRSIPEEMRDVLAFLFCWDRMNQVNQFEELADLFSDDDEDVEDGAERDVGEGNASQDPRDSEAVKQEQDASNDQDVCDILYVPLALAALLLTWYEIDTA